MVIDFPNGLIFVQMFNFLLAFLMLKYIIFKPGLALIQQEDAYTESLEQTSGLAHEEVAYEEGELYERWKRCKGNLQAKQPDISAQQPFHVAHRHKGYVDLQPADEKKMVKLLSAAIFKQVTKHEHR